MTSPETPQRPLVPDGPPVEPVAGPPERWPEMVPQSPPPARPRWLAGVAMAAAGAVLALVGAFGPWARYDDGATISGVGHGDGRLVVVLVVVVAAVCAAAASPRWQRPARLALLACSGVLYLLYGLNRLELSRAEDEVTGEPVALGGGLVAVAAGATLILIGALSVRPPGHEDT